MSLLASAKPIVQSRTMRKSFLAYDRILLFSALSLIILGLVMVTSASIVVSEKQYLQPFHFLIRQVIYLVIGFFVALFVVRFELEFWRKLAPLLLLISFGLLIAVLLPGIGRQINGSSRWIGLGPIGMQVSEVAKIFTIIFLADYLVRRQDEVRTEYMGFVKPMILLAIMSLLLLKEPDYGAAAVIMVTALAMMFLAGVRFWQFAILMALVVVALGVLAISSPYRLERLTAFLNPWANQYDSGYQLTQSLIAFGRGGWFGVGLGQSVQKLFYLPEAHTDFVFAVYAEEMGLVGVLAVIALYVVFIGRAFMISTKALSQDRLFAGYLAFGIALWLGMQAIINMGVNSGLLPTKGLTLPLMSYGGSSMVVMCFVLALLFRIDFESRRIALRELRGK